VAGDAIGSVGSEKSSSSFQVAKPRIAFPACFSLEAKPQAELDLALGQGGGEGQGGTGCRGSSTL